MIIRALASGSSGNAYYVSDGETPLLLEAGIPWKAIQKGLIFRTSEIGACLVSHGHMDHCKSVHDVLKAGIDVIMSGETAQQLGVFYHHRTYVIMPQQQYTIGSWIIKAFEVQHDIEGCYGYLLYSKATGDKLCYITDSFYSRYVFRDISHFLIEINYDMQTLNENVAAGIVPVEMKNRLLQSHFSLENAVDFLKANNLSKVKGIWIIHSSDQNADRERIKRTVQSVCGKPVYIC
jgi:phosphoribosyl 1,2-cyclic phosphodiesterase